MAAHREPALVISSASPEDPPEARVRPENRPDLVRLRRGAYSPRNRWSEAHAAERYRLKVVASAAAARSARVLSHESAAVLLGLPVLGPLPEKVHVLATGRNGGRSSGLVIRHTTAAIPDTVETRGLTVTSPARTVVDLARSRSFASALVSADHALAQGMCRREDLDEEIGRMGRIQGSARARYVVERADGRAESPGESLSRARLYEAGLVIPELQVEFIDDDGLIGRVDFWWKKHRVIGEFDGKSKYGVTAGESAEALWREKLREDRLRRQGTTVIRWTWDDALRPGRLATLLHRAGVGRSGE